MFSCVKGLHNVFDDGSGAWDSTSAPYNTYPYLQDDDRGGTLKHVYWEAASQNYCRELKNSDNINI